MEGCSDTGSSSAVKNTNKAGSRKKMCPDCAKKGISSRIRLFHINFDEAVYLCDSDSCLFPLSCNPDELIIPCKVSDYLAKQRKRKKKNRPTRAAPLTNNPVAAAAAAPLAEIPAASDPAPCLDLDLDHLFSAEEAPVQNSDVADLAAMLDAFASADADFLEDAEAAVSASDDLPALLDSFSPPEPTDVVQKDVASDSIQDGFGDAVSAAIDSPQDVVFDSTVKHILPDVTCDSTLEQTLPDVTCDSTPEQTLPDVPCDSTPEQTLPDVTCDPTPEQTLPDVTCDSTLEQILPDVTCDSTPEQTLPDVTCDSTLEQSLPDVTCDSTPKQILPANAAAKAAIGSVARADSRILEARVPPPPVVVVKPVRGRPAKAWQPRKAAALAPAPNPFISLKNSNAGPQPNPPVAVQKPSPTIIRVEQSAPDSKDKRTFLVLTIDGAALQPGATLDEQQLAAIQKQLAALGVGTAAPQVMQLPAAAPIQKPVRTSLVRKPAAGQQPAAKRAAPQQPPPALGRKRPKMDLNTELSLGIFGCVASERPPSVIAKPSQPKTRAPRAKKAKAKAAVVPEPSITRVSRWLENQKTSTTKQFAGYQPMYLMKAAAKQQAENLSDDSGIQSPPSGLSEGSSGCKQTR